MNAHSTSADLARIIYERFCCNRGDESQNPLRYSFFAPRSCNGRSTSQARWRRTWTRSERRPGRRARHSVGQHPAPGCLPPSRARLWNLPRPLLQGGQPPCRIPTKGAHPLRNCQAGCYPASRLRAPVSAPHPSLPHNMGEGEGGGPTNRHE